MKNKLIIGLIAFVSAFNLISCDVEPLDSNIIEDPGGPSTTEGSFEVKIDGVQYTALATEAVMAGGAVTIAATRADGDSFAFVIGGNTAGTYAANQNIMMFTQSGSQQGWQSINPANPGENTGSVVITEVNATTHMISGTFNFKGYWSGTGDVALKDFTEGTFTVPYTDNIGGPTDDSLTAQIDGAAFNATNIQAQETTNGGISVIQIAGVTADATLSLLLKSDITVGSHPIVDGTVITDGVQVMYLSISGEGGGAVSGSVNVTEKSAGHVKGTFTATIEGASTNYEVTQGTFDVTY